MGKKHLYKMTKPSDSAGGRNLLDLYNDIVAEMSNVKKFMNEAKSRGNAAQYQTFKRLHERLDTQRRQVKSGLDNIYELMKCLNEYHTMYGRVGYRGVYRPYSLASEKEFEEIVNAQHRQ